MGSDEENQVIMAHNKRDVCYLCVEKMKCLSVAHSCLWSSNEDVRSDQTEAGSRDLYLNLYDARDSAWGIQELNKYDVMIASHGLVLMN